MKTTEEKAKAYDEALSRASNLHKDAVEMENNMVIKTCEVIFPQLKESEDERIKSSLIQWINEFPDTIWRGHYKKDIVAWLEKQDGQKSVECIKNEALSELLNKVICRFINNPDIPYSEREEVSVKLIPYVEMLEKQGEQKPVVYNAETYNSTNQKDGS